MEIVKPTIVYDGHFGSDYDISRVAGICRNIPNKSEEHVKRRIDYLIKNEEESAFEQGGMRFKVRSDIPCARQWFRHRMASPLEISGRFTISKKTYHIPETVQGVARTALIQQYREAEKCYDELLEMGVKPEDARRALPQGMMTEYFWFMNLRSAFNFLKQRTDSHAEAEIRKLAYEMFELLKITFPFTMASFEKHVLSKNPSWEPQKSTQNAS